MLLRVRAELRRLRGTVVSDEILGQTISYNNLSEVFIVDGKATGGKTEALAPINPDGGRVRAVLSPRPASGDKK